MGVWNDVRFGAVRVLFVSNVDESYAITPKADSHTCTQSNIIFCRRGWGFESASDGLYAVHSRLR